MATVPGADKGKDPYMVLGVQWSASQDEIEAAFESAKLSLAADGVDESSQEYAELAAAFSQLSDPEKRREIDMESEREALELPAPSQQEAVTSLGLRGSVMAAVATRLGRDVRTAVAPKVLQQLESGSLIGPELGFDVRGEQGTVAAAGMCFGDYDVHELTVPAPGSDRTGDWEAQLFQHLESLVPRPRHQLRAGQYLVAVYCDNFLKGLKYQLLLHAFASEELEQLRSLEEQLVRKREQIRAFEWEFREAQQRWQHCCDRLLQESAEMDAMVSKRDAAYLAFQGSAQPPSPAAPQDTEAGHEELGAAAGSGRWGQGVLEGVRLGGRGLLGRLRPGAKDAAAPSTPGQRSSGDSETAEAAPDGGPAAGPAAAASGSGSARFGAAGRLGGSMRQLGSSVKGMLSRGRAQTPWSDAAQPVDLGDSHVNVAGMDDPVDSSPEADTQPVRSAAAAPPAARAGEQAATATAGVDHLAASLCDEGGQS